MEKTFVAEFDEDMRALAPKVADEITRKLRVHKDVPRATGELATSIQTIDIRITTSRILIDYDALADHANILDKGIKIQPILPKNKKALASADGSFGPVAFANPARVLNKYRGWWEKVFRAVTDRELTRLIEENLGNRR